VADARMLKLSPGESVSYEGEEYFIKQVTGLTHLVLIHPDTKVLKEVAISEISGVNDFEVNPTSDLALIPDAKWNEAIKRFEIIKPLLVNGRTRPMVEARANEYGFSTNSLYGWIRRYETTGKVTELLTDERADKGESKLSQQLQDLIKDVIKTEYKTRQKKSITKVHRELKIRCRELGLKVPHYNTLRAWIKKEHPKDIERLREGDKKAAEKYSPIRGKFPGAEWPFSFVQVDHTQLDIQLCDDYWRKPVGRPWIFGEIKQFVSPHISFNLSNEKKLEIISRHLKLELEEKGKINGIKEMRKHLAGYTKGIRGGAKVRDAINNTFREEEIIGLISELFLSGEIKR